jgi:hypothetical protein
MKTSGSVSRSSLPRTARRKQFRAPAWLRPTWAGRDEWPYVRQSRTERWQQARWFTAIGRIANEPALRRAACGCRPEEIQNVFEAGGHQEVSPIDVCGRPCYPLRWGKAPCSHIRLETAQASEWPVEPCSRHPSVIGAAAANPKSTRRRSL